MVVRVISLLISAFLCVLLLVGCGSTPWLASIALTPGSATLQTIGATAQFKAVGTYQNRQHPQTANDITSQVTWTSSVPSVATINTSGMATAVDKGTTTITAAWNGVTATSILTVVASAPPVRTLTSITVTPGSQTLNSIGEPAQFIATGNFSATPLTQDMTAQVQWTSSGLQVATISVTGQATALSAGVTTITAASGGVVGTAILTVTGTVPPVGTLTSITVNPSAQIATTISETAHFMAIGYFSASPTALDMTGLVRWISSDPQVATISSTGVATALSPGTTTITAASGGVLGTATMTVTSSALPHTLTSITIIPSAQVAMSLNEPGQFIAIGNYTGSPATQDLTKQVAWLSSDTSVATIDPSTGAAVALGTGTATITATSNGVVGMATLTVTATMPPPRQLTSITVIPSSQTTMAIGETGQFMAIGNYIGSPATEDLTAQVTWLSSDVRVATITSAGVATTAGPGTTTIMAASSGGIVGTATLTVTASAILPSQLTAINIIPSAETGLQVGDQAQLIAIGSYTGSPSTQDISAVTKWSSSNQGVATVDAKGLTTTVGLGTTTITASGDINGNSGIVGTATLTVTALSHTLTSITVIPSSQTLMTVGEQGQFLAIGNFNVYPLTQDMTTQVIWGSSDAAVVTVNGAGLATAGSVGTATITANANGVVGTSTITVTTNNYPHQLTALTIIPATGVQKTTALGETVQYIAIGSFIGTPTTQDMTNQVSWISSDVRVATINSSGLATAVGSVGIPGETTITAMATSNGATITGTSDLTVGNTGINNLPTLTVYEFGQGTGMVQSFTSNWVPGDIINCGSGTGCTGHYALNASVILTAKTSPGSKFGGFSANCFLLIPDPNPLVNNNPNYCIKEEGVQTCTCQMIMGDNATVGAIFNLF
jgi:uncharacterized protein YjdB